jgi:glycosyltransferase involved in cell wall biosynthesis
MSSPMHVVFVHPAFPAQFGHIARRLAADPGYRCTFVSEQGEDAPEAISPQAVDGPIERIRYRPTGDHGASRYLTQDIDEEIAHAEGVFETLAPLRDSLRPDLIVGHAGWGSTLFLPELFPDVPVIDYVEYYTTPGDTGLRSDWPIRQRTRLRRRVQSAGVLLHLESATAAYTPTRFQRSLVPERYRSKVRVIHDGIDTDFWRRSTEPSAGGGPRIVTFVSRGLEAMRGFDIFMEVARRICDVVPDVTFFVVGSDEPTYGHDAELIDAPSLREHILARGQHDLDRFRFFGWVPPENLLRILCMSDLHIYLTVPFVLSWSLLDAMACGCTVLASDTEPVREVIHHERNGLLAGFSDIDALTRAAVSVLEDPAGHADLGREAERTIRRRYALDVALPKLTAFFEEVAGRTEENEGS